MSYMVSGEKAVPFQLIWTCLYRGSNAWYRNVYEIKYLDNQLNEHLSETKHDAILWSYLSPWVVNCTEVKVGRICCFTFFPTLAM